MRSVTKRPTFLQARLLLLTLGVGLAVGQAILAWERGAPPTEVLAPILYIPVFAGAIFFGLAGGLVAATGSSALYALVLLDQSSALGMALFVGLLLNRVATFVFYAVLVALGSRFIEGRLRKLEIYDQVDDDTTLYNAAFFLEDSDLEMSRARRYQSIFSVAEVRMDRGLFAGTSSRKYKRALRELGGLLGRAVRTVDRPARVDDGTSDRFLVILPETGHEGSQTLAGRLETATRNFLAERDITANGTVSARALTFPGNESELEALRQEVADADARRRAISDKEGVAR